MPLTNQRKTRSLKVFQGTEVDYQLAKGGDRQVNLVVAAYSWAEAHRIVSKEYRDMTLHHMKNYWSITGNEKQIAAATAKPQTLLYSAERWSNDYREVPA